MRIARLLALLVPLALCLQVQVAAADELIGHQVEDFTLQDFYGEEHALSDLAEKKVVVLAFIGTECPLVKLYSTRMQELADEFAPQGVAFLGINSNRQDAVTELAAFARIHEVKFPLLKDLGNKVADQVGATRTPQMFVLDENRVIRYHGRIDQQYTFGGGVGYSAPKLKRRDLAEAITEVLADKDVSVAVTEAKGCIIGRVREIAEDAEVTYSNQIARILQDRCIECHRQDQIAPFTLTNYDDVAGWGEMIAEVVQEQRMPPWHANPKHGDFSNDARLTDEEKEAIFAWVDAGCPEGDPADLPEPRQYSEGWFLPHEPDQIVYMSDEPVDVKAEGVEDYRHYSVDPGFTEDKWVKLAECMPGNRQVVHHIIVFVQPPKQEGRQEGARRRRRGGDGDISGFGFLAGFAPGTRPMISPDGTAKKIPAGSKLVFQMHYTPCGSPQKDRSSIGLIFMDEDEVQNQLSTTAASYHALEIPPHEDHYEVQAHKTFTRDATLISLFPHMHVRGKAFRYELNYPDGSHEVLLDVPHYDFNWQNSFILAEPKLIPKGTEMVCTAVYDNSENNLANPNPDETVRWGPQTWHEMMLGWYDVSFPVADASQLIEKDQQQQEKNKSSESGD